MKTSIAKGLLILILPALMILGLLASSAQAAPLAQLTPFPSPTPGADGRILYVVQQGDTLWRIAAITGISLDQLRTLNKLTNDIVATGDVLLLGYGGPSSTDPTPGPSPTPPAFVPSPTPLPGFGNICVILYFDENGDAIRQEEEPWILGGQISVVSQDGSVSETTPTMNEWDEFGDPDHHCFEELSEGNYNVTVAIPEGYNATTTLNKSIRLNGGDTTYLSFGAQLSNQIISQPGEEGGPVQAQPEPRSPTLAIVGGIMLAAGLGLGIYAYLVVRRR